MTRELSQSVLLLAQLSAVAATAALGMFSVVILTMSARALSSRAAFTLYVLRHGHNIKQRNATNTYNEEKGNASQIHLFKGKILMTGGIKDVG